MNIDNPTASVTPSASGQYTGDDTANRAIPHGLGRVPSGVLISLSTGFSTFHIISTAGKIVMLQTAMLAVTAVDATNFYVGNATNYGQSANANLSVYNWAAY